MMQKFVYIILLLRYQCTFLPVRSLKTVLVERGQRDPKTDNHVTSMQHVFNNALEANDKGMVILVELTQSIETTQRTLMGATCKMDMHDFLFNIFSLEISIWLDSNSFNNNDKTTYLCGRYSLYKIVYCYKTIYCFWRMKHKIRRGKYIQLLIKELMKHQKQMKQVIKAMPVSKCAEMQKKQMGNQNNNI